MNITIMEKIEIIKYYNNILNLDKTKKNSNDEPTPIECIIEMIEKIPEDLWNKKDLKILDPCCGNGNFFIPIYYKLQETKSHEEIINSLEFNDINEERLKNVKTIFGNNTKITKFDFLNHNYENNYDLIVANPPYAKILENGKRASKNHNLIKLFIEKSLQVLKPNGYLMFLVPNNWMTFANNNKLISKLTKLQFIHLDIGNAKKYFKKIGSSFTWFILKNTEFSNDFSISGLWKNKKYNDILKSQERKFIPLVYNKLIQNILNKTIDKQNEKFNIQTSSFLHHYTKKEFINKEITEIYKYKLIHTPKQIVYSKIPHKYQDGYKIFISTTDKYNIFIDNCGMTQSICFILVNSLEEGEKFKKILLHPLYIFLNNICRWGNFNNIRILQNFPKPLLDVNIFEYFNITNEEQEFILNNS